MIDDLIKEYTNAAELHGIGTLEGDYNKTNSAYENLNKIYLELKKSGKLDVLKRLLIHQNLAVRCWSATHLLSIDENESLKTLEEIALKKSPFGLSAKYVIKEWKAGRLKLLD